MPIVSPSTDLYTISTGILYIANRTLGVPNWPEDFDDMGDISKMAARVTSSPLEHKSLRTGALSLDKVVYKETGYNGSFDCDEASQANLAKFFQASIVGNVLRANQAVTNEYTLRFEGTNIVGELRRYTFRRCKVTPNGDLSLHGENWQILSFAFAGLVDSANPSSPFFDSEYLTTTTL